MCCEGWNYRATTKKIGECPECGGEVDEDGEALVGCHWSPIDCDTCGARPCDDSC